MNGTCLHIVLGRDDLLAGNLEPVLAVLDPARLPAGPRLAALHGQVRVNLDAARRGQPRSVQIYEVESARAYARALWRALPGLAFFLPRQGPGLWRLTACALAELTVVRSPRVAGTRLVEWRGPELVALIEGWTPALEGICARAGYDEEGTHQFLLRLYAYYRDRNF